MPRIRIERITKGKQAEGTSGRSSGLLRYYDRSSNRTIEYSESSRHFLALARRDESEGFRSIQVQKLFRVSPSSSKDGVFILEVTNEAESPVEVSKAVENLKKNDAIEDIVPGLINQYGQVVYRLPGQVVIRFVNLSESAIASYLSSLRSRILRQAHPSGLYVASIPQGSEISTFIKTLNSNPNVLFAEPAFYGVNDSEVRVAITTDTPSQTSDNGSSQPPSSASPSSGGSQSSRTTLPWNLAKISVADAWRLTKGRSNIVVAVIDGRPEANHKALTGKFLVPMNQQFLFSETYKVSHATNICSVIAGESRRLSGVAPGVTLLPLVVNLYHGDYAARSAAILEAAQLARQKRVGKTTFSRMVLSCSWKTSGDIASIRTALEEAIRAGIVVFCSAGNGNNDRPHFPSDYSAWTGVLGEGIISVAGTDRNDRKYRRSNFSSKIDVSAPAGDGEPFDEEDVLCADQDNSYAYAHGTSIAAPHVAAISALMLSLNPNLTPKIIKALIRNNVDAIWSQNPGYENLLGTGRVNAYKTLSAVSQAQSVTTSTTDDSSTTPSYGPKVTFQLASRN